MHAMKMTICHHENLVDMYQSKQCNKVKLINLITI